MKERKPKYKIGDTVAFKNKNYIWNGPKYISGVIKSITTKNDQKIINGKTKTTTNILYMVRYNTYSFNINERAICANINKLREKERKVRKSHAEKALKMATTALEKNKKYLAELEAKLKEIKVK